MIAGSRELEATLRICAKFTRNTIDRERVREVAEAVGILDVHEKLLQLQDVKRGRVLVSAKGLRFPLRFRDPLFRIFIERSESLLPAVKGDVDDAWATCP